MRAWTADDGALATLARLYAIESGQPQISRTKREGLIERYGFADGEGTRLLPGPLDRDVEHAAEVRELISEVVERGRRGRARHSGGVGLPRELAPARRRLGCGDSDAPSIEGARRR